MDDMIAIRHPEDEELGRRLVAFADARLSPDSAAMARIRNDLVASAAARPDGRADASSRPSAPSGRSRTRRVPVAVLAAAVAIALIAGTVGAARPGGPVYAVRLWVESATLPADPAARSAADLDLLDARVEEARSAASVHDPRGVAAALEAYRFTVDDALAAGAGSDAALRAALVRHLLVLRTLAGTLPDEARTPVELAITSSSAALDRIDERGGGEPAVDPGGGSPPDGLTPREPPGETKPDTSPNARKPSEPPGETKPDRRPALYDRWMLERHPDLELVVLGAGPAYTDRAGASGAAYLIRSGDASILLDLGHGSFARLAAEIEPSRLAGIAISHLHPDHFIDLVPLRHYLRWEWDPSRRVRVFAPDGLDGRLDALHAQVGFTAEALDVEPLAAGVTQVGLFTLEARLVTHTAESYGFRVSVDGGPGLVYSGDCGRAEDLDAIIRAGDTVLVEVYFGTGPVFPGARHLDAAAVAALARRTDPGTVLLTHIGMGRDRDATLEIVAGATKARVEVVDPGYRMRIS